MSKNIYTILIDLNDTKLEVFCIDLKFGSNEFHERIVDRKNDLENVLNDILVPYIVKNFLDYNC
jgi:hypothetical protein